MRAFDIIGAACVTAWVALIGAFTYHLNTEPPATQIGDEIVIEAGDSWMMLRQGDEDTGYVHETRTHIEDGWLFEYEMVMILELAGQPRLLETHTRATLDEDGLLRQFNADVSSFLTDLIVKGRVEDGAIHLETRLGEGTRTRTIPLEEPPRLANSALNQLVAARDELTPGQRIEREYFDPMSGGVKNLVYEYVGPDEVDVYGQTYEAMHFRQQLLGDELDVYVSPSTGEVLIQEFPMGTIGALVQEELGKTRASALRRRFQKKRREADRSQKDEADDEAARMREEIRPDEVGVTEALKLLGDTLAPEREKEGAPAARSPDMGAPDMSAAPEADAGSPRPLPLDTPTD